LLKRVQCFIFVGCGAIVCKIGPFVQPYLPQDEDSIM
jgi:hypothetical protein